MEPIIQVKNLNKVYQGGLKALEDVSLDIKQGEIIALLGPNGAGKTTLISMICGLTTISSGSVTVGGYDIQKQSRLARGLIGLVPQELTINMFEWVWEALRFSRGVFGLPPNPQYLEDLLRELSLWDKKKSNLMSLSGGMKRRVMIAKALAHEPKVLFLDEPTAGVDVELRKGMWAQIKRLRDSGVTIILTTHYIEEAEEMADRIGVINSGKVVLVEEKETLIQKMGKKEMVFELESPLTELPSSFCDYSLEIVGNSLRYDYKDNRPVSELIELLKAENISFKDIKTKQRSLEDIFVELVKSNES